MAGQTINVSVLADTKPFASAMRGLSEKSGLGKLSELAAGAAKAVGALALAGGAAMGALAVNGVKAASNLQQSIGGMEAVFKEQSAQMHAWAASAATDLGLSKNSYNELATIIGTTLKNSGTPMDELGGQTQKLMTISADMAATFGGPVTDASNAVASALRGEMEPLRAYGVSLNAAAIESKALADTGKATAAELTAQDKALATQALIFEQSADAQGAFARESNTLAGQTERLKAKFENISATIGEYFLPVLTGVVTWVSDRIGPAFETLQGGITALGAAFAAGGSDVTSSGFAGGMERVGLFARQVYDVFTAQVLPALRDFGSFLTGTLVPAVADFGGWIQRNSAWLIPLAVGIAGAVAGFMAFQKAMALWKAITTAAAAAQVLLNVAMSANPIGIIVALLVGLVAVIVYLWNTNETFRNVIITVWEAIKSFIGAAVEGIMGFFQGLAAVPGNIAAWFGQAKDMAIHLLVVLVVWLAGLPGRAMDALSSLGSSVANVASAAWEWFKTTSVNTVTGLVSWLTGLPGRAMSALGSLGSSLANTATAAFEWMKSAAVNKATQLISWVRNLPGEILAGLGNLGSLLANAGNSVIQGFIDGVRNAFQKVRNTLGELTDMLPDWKGPAPRDATILRKAGHLVVGGFDAGLRDKFGTVRKTLGQLTDLVAATPAPRLAGVAMAPTPDLAGRGTRIGENRRYTVHVKALTATKEVGRVVVKAIKDFEGSNGTGRA